MRKISCCVGIVILIFGIFGCAHKSYLPYPKVDTVLVVNRPFDFTYLEVLKALDELHDWELSNTEKSAGVIVLNNQKYWDTFDADKLQAVLVIKSIDRTTTSVSLAPESQTVIDGKDVMNAMEKALSKYKK
ncbi:MAG TPA: hypothetical protein PKL97_09950 [Candidatus Omnitrophota bacterium]|nr:hypothetical protein [Candidatus Omnitrophota bacterium]